MYIYIYIPTLITLFYSYLSKVKEYLILLTLFVGPILDSFIFKGTEEITIIISFSPH